MILKKNDLEGFSLPVIYFSSSLESFPNLARKFHTILGFSNFMFPKIQWFFGILKLALCAVPLGKSLTVGRSIPPGSISVLGLFLEKSCRRWVEKVGSERNELWAGRERAELGRIGPERDELRRVGKGWTGKRWVGKGWIGRRIN